MERQAVNSSMIASVGYDSSTSTLEIEFKKNGAVWQYFDVSESVYYEMMSGSIGKNFLAMIKGQYVESQVG
ncbi:MAG: KTSC domain-containing protein [Bdellovibrio sp.]|nr:KTSC domain-containing protein [Bdellovibrio sp.]